MRTALRRYLGGSDPGLVIATAARDHGHPDGPAGPVWGLWTPHGDAVPRRCRLAELPQRGPDVEHGTLPTDQPFSEAAFDPNDREMLRRIDAPEPKLAARPDYLDDEHDPDDVALYEDLGDDLYRAPTALQRPDVSSRRWT